VIWEVGQKLKLLINREGKGKRRGDKDTGKETVRETVQEKERRT